MSSYLKVQIGNFSVSFRFQANSFSLIEIYLRFVTFSASSLTFLCLPIGGEKMSSSTSFSLF